MTIRYLMRAVAMALQLLALLPMQAKSVDLTIRFTGKFVESTCDYAIPDVNLGDYDVGYFSTIPQSPWVPVTVTANNCQGVDTIHMAFNNNTAHPSNNQLYAISNIPGLGIELQNMTGGNATPNAAVFDWPLAGFGTTYRMQARLSKVGTVTVGVIHVPVVLQFTYN